MEKWSDFVVETKGHCFLCLDKISPLLSQDGKPDHGSDSVAPLTCSLQSLSRYLGMELRKVFHQGAEDLIPPHLFETIKNSKLRGELCEQCARLNASFGMLVQKLEKIQLELLASLNKICKRLLQDNGTDKLEGLRILTESMSSSGAGWNGKLDILEVLRADAIEKCSRILSAALPRVKVQNMSQEQMHKVAEKLQSIGKSISEVGNLESTVPKSEMEPGTEDLVTVKMEYSSVNRIPRDVDNNYYPDGDSDTFSDSPNVDLELTNNWNMTASPCTSKQVKRERENDVSSRAGMPNVDIPPTVLNPETWKYKCSLCAIEFKTERSFKEHYRASHLNIKFKCTVCGKEFSRKAALYTHHLKAHMGISYPCNICGRRFSQKGGLRYHQRATSCRLGMAPEPKKHKCHCQLCGTGFTTTSTLKRHLADVHSSSREHVCDLCGLKFKRKAHLLRHKSKVECRQK